MAAVKERVWLLRDLKQFKKVNAPDDIGIEIEWEFKEPDQALYDWDDINNGGRKWKREEDGSLRNGYEWKSQPDDNIEKLLQVLEPYVAKEKDNFRISHRCSVHVHLNYVHRTLDDAINFLLAWTVLEPFMLQVSGNRSDSNYCVSVKDGFPAYQNVIRMIKECKNAGLMDHLMDPRGRHDLKYSAVNFLPLTDFGTIEVRTHEGTTDLQRILKWCKLLMKLREVTTGHKPWDYITEISNGDPLDLIQPLGYEGLLEYPNAYEMFRKGVYRATSLLQDTDKVNNQFEILAKKMRVPKAKGAAKKRLGGELFVNEAAFPDDYDPGDYDLEGDDVEQQAPQVRPEGLEGLLDRARRDNLAHGNQILAEAARPWRWAEPPQPVEPVPVPVEQGRVEYPVFDRHGHVIYRYRAHPHEIVAIIQGANVEYYLDGEIMDGEQGRANRIAHVFNVPENAGANR